MQKPRAPGLVVVSELDYKILLVHKICAPSKYNRQGGAMLSAFTWYRLSVMVDRSNAQLDQQGSFRMFF